MRKVIEDLYIKYKDSTIWITGDFNLPNIDWNSISVVNNVYPLDICNPLIDVFNLGEFSQMVNIPTQGSNILAINRPRNLLSNQI